MHIHQALSDIAEIRAQLDRTETYRGFRSTAVGMSVVVLMVGVWVERFWVGEPLTGNVGRYLTVWIGVAAGSGLMVVIEMVIRGRKSESRIVWKVHRSLAQQIAPSLFVGFLLTVLIASHAVESQRSEVSNSLAASGMVNRDWGMMWALPGVWALVYGVGLFSCQRNLPQQAVGVAIFFLGSGTIVLGYSWITRELAGWQMLVTFGVGQSLLAGVLFWDLEKRRDKTEQ